MLHIIDIGYYRYFRYILQKTKELPQIISFCVIYSILCRYNGIISYVMNHIDIPEKLMMCISEDHSPITAEEALQLIANKCKGCSAGPSTLKGKISRTTVSVYRDVFVKRL